MIELRPVYKKYECKRCGKPCNFPQIAVLIESSFSHKNHNPFCTITQLFAHVNYYNEQIINYLNKRLVGHGEFPQITEVVAYLKF